MLICYRSLFEPPLNILPLSWPFKTTHTPGDTVPCTMQAFHYWRGNLGLTLEGKRQSVIPIIPPFLNASLTFYLFKSTNLSRIPTLAFSFHILASLAAAAIIRFCRSSNPDEYPGIRSHLEDPPYRYVASNLEHSNGRTWTHLHLDALSRSQQTNFRSLLTHAEMIFQ